MKEGDKRIIFDAAATATHMKKRVCVQQRSRANQNWHEMHFSYCGLKRQFGLWLYLTVLIEYLHIDPCLSFHVPLLDYLIAPTLWKLLLHPSLCLSVLLNSSHFGMRADTFWHSSQFTESLWSLTALQQCEHTWMIPGLFLLIILINPLLLKAE